MNCKHFRIRHKNKKIIFYCNLLKREITNKECCTCLLKEFKEYKLLKAKIKKENNRSIFKDNFQVEINGKTIKCYVTKIKGYEKHHFIGGKNRNNSDKYGLFAWISKDDHRYLTTHPIDNLTLQRIAELELLKIMSKQEFISIFGEDYMFRRNKNEG